MQKIEEQSEQSGRAEQPIGRFAPTPGGELHAGNLLCALLAYLSVKSRGGRFLIRIEDLDAVRCPVSAGQKVLDTLAIFGLTSDEPPIWQRNRGEAYARAEERLRRVARVYPCFCSRAQLHVAEAPRLRDGSVVYNGACRNLSEQEVAARSAKRAPCFRVEVPHTEVAFTDGLAGPVRQNLAEECGDFIIRRSDGVYAYQLAVAVDDAESGVTEVVRGNDLLLSTPRQIWLLQQLGYPVPSYYHIPLACDSAGRKLSKSEGDGIARCLSTHTPQEILGSLAFAAGLREFDAPATPSDLIPAFDWRKVRRDTILLPAHLR